MEEVIVFGIKAWFTMQILGLAVAVAFGLAIIYFVFKG